MPRASLRDLRFVGAGLSVEAAAEACGVDPRTFRRWEHDNRAPLAVQKLLLFLSGELMHIDPQFKGFRLGRGKLFHPQAPNGLAPGDLLGMPWVLAERDELRRQVKQLQSAMDHPDPERVDAGAISDAPHASLIRVDEYE